MTNEQLSSYINLFIAVVLTMIPVGLIIMIGTMYYNDFIKKK